MKIFIAGSGIPHGDNAVFSAAFYALKECGYTPVTGYHAYLNPEWEDDGWTLVVSSIIRGCDGLALLDNWKDSHGATWECGFASGVGVVCRMLSYWLEH